MGNGICSHGPTMALYYVNIMREVLSRGMVNEFKPSSIEGNHTLNNQVISDHDN